MARDTGHHDGELTAAAARAEERAAWRVLLGDGWRLMRELWQEIGDDRVVSVAAGVTFYVVLSMVPAMTALVSLFGLIADPGDAGGIFSTASAFLPTEAAQLLTDQAVRIAGKPDERLSVATMIALVLALWSANGGTRALIEALVIARDETETRSFLWLNFLSLAFTFGALVVLIVLSGVIAALPAVLGWFGLADWTEILIIVGRLPLVVCLLFFALAVLYRWGPVRCEGKPRWFSPGVVIAALLLLACSSGFGRYVRSFGSYDETYGSLAAVAVSMMWVWLSTLAVLIGAEIDAILERRAHPPAVQPPVAAAT